MQMAVLYLHMIMFVECMFLQEILHKKEEFLSIMNLLIKIEKMFYKLESTRKVFNASVRWNFWFLHSSPTISLFLHTFSSKVNLILPDVMLVVVDWTIAVEGEERRWGDPWSRSQTWPRLCIVSFVTEHAGLYLKPEFLLFNSI